MVRILPVFRPVGPDDPGHSTRRTGGSVPARSRCSSSCERARWVTRRSPRPSLAGHYGLSPSVITRVLARLESSGFIDRRPDPTDGRAQTVHITPTGARISEYIERQYDRTMLESMAFIDDAQLETLRDAMELLTRIATDLDARRRSLRPGP